MNISRVPDSNYFTENLQNIDPEVYDAIHGELRRQQEGIELIASENIVSSATLEALGSVMINKTVEGYPGRRYYGGAQFADDIENLAIERAKRLFGCCYANVQPHSNFPISGIVKHIAPLFEVREKHLRNILVVLNQQDTARGMIF